MATQVPLMDTSRARTELGWVPKYDSLTAMTDLLEGMAAGAGTSSPALRPRALLKDRPGRGRPPGYGTHY
jgi:hypothetical protein